MRSGWHRLSFSDAVSDESAGHFKTPQSEYLAEGRFPVIDQGKSFVAGYVNDSSRLCRSQLPVIVFGDHTRCFKFVDFPFCIGADGVKVLRPKGELNPRYLYHYFRTVSLTDGGYDRHFKYLKRLEIPFPSSGEQERIAEVLDRADALRAKRQDTLTKGIELLRSWFLEIFGDPVANPKNWDLKEIKQIGRVITGNTPLRARSDYYGNVIEWVKSDNLNTPHHIASRSNEHLSEAGRAVARTVPPGAILVTCIAGTPACIGNAALVDREVAFNQQISALVPEIGDGRFLYSQIQIGKRLIQAASTASMKGMVSKSRFENVRLMFPPLELQRQFGAIFERLEALGNQHHSSLTQLDALFASLQHRAFRGEL